VKSELKDLESICEATLKENEDLYKDLDSKSKIVKDFYHLQLSRISVAYENALKILQQKKRELQSLISKYLSDQCKVIEKHKDGVSKILESSTKLLQQLKLMEKDLPHYESLCSNIKSLKQELKYLEYPIETFHYQYMSFKTPEAINLILGSLEELEDLSELESLGQKPKKSCSHTVKSVLTNTNLNENPAATKSTTPKILEKNFKAEDKNPENRSPDKAEKVTKNRQNFNSRNHPKRMPWKKRNRSL
jgi:vacuolar-type H+-ATPase subunit H